MTTNGLIGQQSCSCRTGYQLSSITSGSCISTEVHEGPITVSTGEILGTATSAVATFTVVLSSTLAATSTIVSTTTVATSSGSGNQLLSVNGRSWLTHSFFFFSFFS
jgi:hypothetical protein